MSDNNVKKGQYIPAKKAAEILGFSTTTLRNWAAQGIIDVMVSPGGRYRYNVDRFLDLAKAASKDRIAKASVKLKDKRAKQAKAAAQVRANRLAERRRLAAEQRSKTESNTPVETDEPSLPF